MSSNHKVKISKYGPDQFIGKCACRLSSGPRDWRKEVEDWHFAHMKDVERARAGLSTKTPTLKSQHAHFVAMSKTGSASDRLLWQQLADELAPRLKDEPGGGTEPLFPV